MARGPKEPTKNGSRPLKRPDPPPKLKEKAGLELQLAVEQRKLAYKEWRDAQFHLATDQAAAQALDQEKETTLRESA